MCVSVDAYKNKSPQSCESPDLGAGNQTQVFLQSTITQLLESSLGLSSFKVKDRLSGVIWMLLIGASTIYVYPSK